MSDAGQQEVTAGLTIILYQCPSNKQDSQANRVLKPIVQTALPLELTRTATAAEVETPLQGLRSIINNQRPVALVGRKTSKGSNVSATPSKV
jgi:hypothetical protein